MTTPHNDLFINKKVSLVELHLLSFLQFCFLVLEQGMSQVITL